MSPQDPIPDDHDPGTPPPPPGGGAGGAVPPPPPPPGGPAGPGPSGPGGPGGPRFDVGTSFTWAWAKFKENATTLVLAVLIVLGVAVVLGIISNLVVGAIFGGGTLEVNSTTGEISGGRGFFGTLVLQLLAGVLSSIVTYFLQAGLVRASLAVADGRKPELGDVFVFDRVGPLAVLALLLTAGTYIGFILCYLPGLVFAVLASFSLFFFVDKGSEGIDAIKQSFRLVIDNFGQLILLFLAVFATLLVGALACGVGLLVAVPVALLVVTHAFRTLTGGPVAQA